jgi:hypothetical protein
MSQFNARASVANDKNGSARKASRTASGSVESTDSFGFVMSSPDMVAAGKPPLLNEAAYMPATAVADDHWATILIDAPARQRIMSVAIFVLPAPKNGLE